MGAQFVPIGMPTVCWKTFPAKPMKILSTRNSSILMMPSSEYVFLESECSFTKYGPSCLSTDADMEVKEVVSAFMQKQKSWYMDIEIFQEAKADKLLPTSVRDIMNTWILQMNYPLITVTSPAQGTLHVTQKRYLQNTSTRDPKKYQSPYG